MGHDSWRRKDKQALVRGIHDQYGIVNNQRGLRGYVLDDDAQRLIDDTIERAERTHSGLSGIVRRLFGREVDEIERRKRSAGR